MEDGKYAQISRPLIEQAQEDTGSYEGSMTEIDFAGVLATNQVKINVLKEIINNNKQLDLTLKQFICYNKNNNQELRRPSYGCTKGTYPQKVSRKTT